MAKAGNKNPSSTFPSLLLHMSFYSSFCLSLLLKEGVDILSKQYMGYRANIRALSRGSSGH